MIEINVDVADSKKAVKSTKKVKSGKAPSGEKSKKKQPEKPAKKPVKKPVKVTKPAKPSKVRKAKAEANGGTTQKKGKSSVIRDVFGFRIGSRRANAAALYANKKTRGATLREINDATGSLQLNLLKIVEKQGYKVTRTKEGSQGKRPAIRYFIVT